MPTRWIKKSSKNDSRELDAYHVKVFLYISIWVLPREGMLVQAVASAWLSVIGWRGW
jgi:hypothetical protein